MTLGSYIEMRRIELGLSLTELASRAGLSHSYLSMLEHGHRSKPSASSLRSLAAALEVPMPHLETLVELDSGRADHLRSLMRTSEKSMLALSRLVADADELLTALSPEDMTECHDLRDNIGGWDRWQKNKYLAADVAKLASELKTLNATLPSVLTKVGTRFEYPRYPDHIEALLFRMQRLGTSGLIFLRDMVAGIEQLMGLAESDGVK